VSVEINFAGRESEYQKQYSVWYYSWMKESLGVGDEVLGKVITSSNVNWAAEHIFEVNYREFWLEEKNGVLYSPDYGSETLLQMADNAILIREKAGANLERAEAEKQGIIELERILAKTKIGQAVVLISPPDPNDKNMAGYNMVYIYERQGEGKIRATAIRDEVSSVRDLQVLANYLSGYPSWNEANNLDFVAKPFVTQLDFNETVREVGVTERDKIPEWVEIMSGEVARAMLSELSGGRMENVKEIFDAYQMVVKTRYELEKGGRKEFGGIDPVAIARDRELWMLAQRKFLELGGMEMIQAGGSCGRGDIGLKQEEWRDNNVMSSLMGVEERREEENYSFDHEGQCVVCKQDPRMLGPCNICEECDHKMRSQGE